MDQKTIERKRTVSGLAAIVLSASLILASPVLPAEGQASTNRLKKIVINDVSINDDAGTAVQISPKLAMSRTGAAVACWMDTRNGNGDNFFQRWNVRGMKAGENVRVTAPGWTGDQFLCDVDMDDRGHFVTVWEERGQGGFDVYATVFAANGVPMRNEFEVFDNSAGQRLVSPAVAMDAAGNFVVCWSMSAGTSTAIYARRFNSLGQPLGPAFKVNDASAPSCQDPDVDMNAEGVFIIAWEQNLPENNKIWAQKFDATGNRIDVNFEVIGHPDAPGSPRDPAVAVEDDWDGDGNPADGGFVITTTRGTSIHGFFVYRYESDGLYHTVLFVGTGEGVKSNSNVAYMPWGHYVTVWTSDREGTKDSWMRVLQTTGGGSAATVRLNDAPGAQDYAWFAGDKNGSGIVAWEDDRRGNPDVYGTLLRINSPLNVVAASGYDDFVPLSWSSPYAYAGTTRYIIKRSTLPAGPYTRIATVNPADRPYPASMLDYVDDDPLLSNGVTVYYVIEMDAADSDGPSLFAAATPKAHGHRFGSSWAAMAPVMDGVISPGEWDDAATMDISCPGAADTVTLYAKNSMNSLYIAVDDRNDRIVDPGNQMGILFDEDHDGIWDPSGLIGEGTILLTPAGIAFSAFGGEYPNHFRAAAPVLAPGATGAISAAGGHVQYELCLDMTTSPLHTTPGDRIGLAVWIADPSNAYAYHYANAGEWPSGALWDCARTTGELNLAARPTDVPRAQKAAEFSLEQNFPNPFNPITTIRFSINEPCRVVLCVFNILGEAVAELADGWMEPGRHQVLFDAGRLPSGVYVCRIEAGQHCAFRKMLFLE